MSNRGCVEILLVLLIFSLATTLSFRSPILSAFALHKKSDPQCMLAASGAGGFMTQCCWYEWDEGSNGVMHYATSVCQLCNFYYSNLTYMDCLPPTTTSVRTLPPGLLNGNLTFSPSGNNTKPSTGLLNGRIPTGAAGKPTNASPITTFN